MNKSTSTSNLLVLSTESSGEESVQVNAIPTVHGKGRINKKTESAVYSYIRAIRALGREQVNTGEIADALSLSVLTVNNAIAALRKKGVKVLNA
jgi:HTH domain